MILDTGICGNRGQCRCSATGEIICSEVEAAPFFKSPLRHGNRLTIKTDDKFDIDTLRITEGFDRVLVIGPSLEQCKTAQYDYPWVVCTTETGSYKPSDRLVTPSTAPPKKMTMHRTTATAEGSMTAATDYVTTAGESGRGKGSGMDSGVLGLIIWNAVWGAAGLIVTCCILFFNFMLSKVKELVIGVLVRLLGKLVMLYIWNVDMVAAFDLIDEGNLFIVILLQMAHFMLQVVEHRQCRRRRNNPFAQPGQANVLNVPDPQQAAPRQQDRAPAQRAVPRNMAGLDLNNIRDRRLRERH